MTGALALLVALGPVAASADPVSIRAGERGQGARLVFDWPAPVTHAARLDGNRIHLTFARDIQTEVGALAARLPAWISGAVLDAGGKGITLTLRRSVTLQSFASGNRVVVDLAPAVSPPAPTPAARPPAPVRAPASPVVPEKPATVAEQPAAVAPAVMASAESMAPTPLKPAVPPPPAQTMAVPAARGPDDAPAPHAAPPVREVSANPLPVQAVPPLEMTVPAGTPVAAFQRGRSFFVVVNDKDTPRDLQQLVGSALAGSDRVQLIPAQGGRVIRIDLASDPIQPAVETTDKGWRLRFDAPAPMTLTPLELDEEPDYALGPRALLKTEVAANPVTFVDPVVGDTLTAVPTGKVGGAILTPAHFVQAELLPTLQGVAVRPLADDLNVISSPLGVEVSATSGFKLSERLASEMQAAPVQTAQMQAPVVPVLPPLFDFPALGTPAGADFTKQREALQDAIRAAVQDQKPAARLALAHFYFINGMPTEAAAMWGMVARDSADLAQRPEYPLVRAIAAFSSGTLDEVKAALTAVGQPTTDLALWRGLLAVRERDWVTASEQFRAGLRRIWDYPEPYMSLLALAAIDTALNTQDLSLAESLLDKLTGYQRLEKGTFNPAVEYFTGVLDWDRDSGDDARAHLGNAASGWNNYWRVRAELALVEADARDPKSNPYDLIHRLERLSYAWRGDALEYDIVDRLAQLRLQVNDYAGAFDSFAQLATKFPGDPRTAGLADQQRAAFVRIFQSEDRDRTPAHIQLAIWNGYPQFRPTQPAVLDEVRGYLAERVAGIDLLPQAVGLYNEVLAGTTDPVRRAELGTRMAGLDLLDRNHEAAMKALDDTEPPAASDRPRVLPDDLRDERRMLRARSVFAAGKPDDALAMLVNDYSEPAMRLRADITWQTKRWAEAAAVLDALIGDLPADGRLADDQAGMVVSRATALALAGDRQALNDMRVKYGAVMAQTPSAAAFQLLTRPDIAGGVPDRATLSGSMAEVDLFQQFLERYRQPRSQPAEPSPAAVAEAPARTVGPGATPQPVQ